MSRGGGYQHAPVWLGIRKHLKFPNRLIKNTQVNTGEHHEKHNDCSGKDNTSLSSENKFVEK